MSIKRLLRESNPPAGMLASPVPQYEDVSTGEPGAVKGRYGAPFSMLLGPDGQPIDPSNPLEVRVRELETELQELRQLLQSGDTKVQLMGRNVEYEIVTLIDAETIPPNGNGLWYVDGLDGGPDEIHMLVNIDQQPWSLRTNPGPWNYGLATISGSTAHIAFPTMTNVTNTYTSTANPRRGLWTLATSDELSSYEEAYRLRQPGGELVRIGVFNGSASQATVTVRALKIWRY